MMTPSARAMRRRAWVIVFITMGVFMLLVATQESTRHTRAHTLDPSSSSSMCRNVLTGTIPKAALVRGVRARREFPSLALAQLSAMLNADMAHEPPFELCVFPECKHAAARGWSGLNHSHGRWAMMGEPVVRCRQMRAFSSGGEGDEGLETRVCWAREWDDEEVAACTVFSLGATPGWEFEASVAEQTPCEIHTFDCDAALDAKVPIELQHRVSLHRYCLGNSTGEDPRYKTLGELREIAHLQGRPLSLLRINTQGEEWQIMREIATLEPRELPLQIAAEMHYLTPLAHVDFHGRDLSPGEIYMHMQNLFQMAGYVLADRRDSIFCAHCSTILLLRVLC